MLLLLCLLTALPVSVLAQDEAVQRQAELEALQERINELRQTLERERGQRDSASEALRAAEEEVGRLGRELRQTERDIRRHEERLNALRQERGERERDIEQERDALARQIQGAYRTGREEQIKLLLNQEDPAAFGRMLVYYDYLNRARTERISRIAEHVRELARLADAVDETLDDLAQARARQRQSLDAMEATRENREAAVARIEERLRDRGQRLTRLEEDEAELQRLIRSLQDTLGDIPSRLHEGRPFGELRGQLPWPTEGRVSRRFNDDRAGGRMRWRGMVIDASAGSEVRAVSHGRVAYSGWLQHYGLILIIDHGDGWLSLYGHNQAVYQDVGDWVDAGDVIASVGDSGGRDASSLYFEIRNGREPVNPHRWLRNR
ncbi:murein hydrolase activator EnvC family protein [Natronospira bacteriovora]|uniref:Peptidoglycan DD-metalloendopeptidase family protein n=1 Tax=Natronospira bacteriovora TaxID=3069753 RepID=A0ABU0W760_9GAMM|nr:peptidoglycan DD-metalloendopeptidase family protein [Natronospira sp. AB-CW4]MDQ2069864.1 peptidoglycan DD-metalloendopeptidase family protein [Natronospira sp. AB-CW4]